MGFNEVNNSNGLYEGLTSAGENDCLKDWQAAIEREKEELEKTGKQIAGVEPIGSYGFSADTEGFIFGGGTRFVTSGDVSGMRKELALHPSDGPVAELPNEPSPEQVFEDGLLGASNDGYIKPGGFMYLVPHVAGQIVSPEVWNPDTFDRTYTAILRAGEMQVRQPISVPALSKTTVNLEVPVDVLEPGKTDLTFDLIDTTEGQPHFGQVIQSVTMTYSVGEFPEDVIANVKAGKYDVEPGVEPRGPFSREKLDQIRQLATGTFQGQQPTSESTPTSTPAPTVEPGSSDDPATIAVATVASIVALLALLTVVAPQIPGFADVISRVMGR